MFFQKSFYNEEIRNEYVISSEMKKIWSVELDLLNELSKVCLKYNIPYYAAGGTLLGAVRHHGIIPWDDDIDIMMFRKDFDYLCKLAPKVFNYPYFFQTEETDPGSFRGHAQLRNSETTGILKNEFACGDRINQGIFIDIFPLDNIPENKKDKKKFVRRVKKYQRRYKEYLSYMHPYRFKFRKNLFLLIYRYAKHVLLSNRLRNFGKCQKYYKYFEQEVQMYKDMETKQIVMSPFYTERWMYNRSDFNDVVFFPFEMLSIPVPSGYINILDKCYGDWNKYVVGGSLHRGVFFDPDKPFTEYIG